MVDTQHIEARGMDLDRPCAARIYDACLGGGHNFGVERRFVERLEARLPGITWVFRENRAFMRRALEYLLDHGIRQFLDLGSGIPTIGHVHEVVKRRCRDFTVLYVDNEPLTVAHSRPLLANEPRVEMIRGDARDPKSILHAPEVSELLDLTKPVGLLMSAMLHFIPDSDDPESLVDTYHDLVAAGSYLMLSHSTDAMDTSAMHTLCDLYEESADPLFTRATDRIDSLFGDFEVLPPGSKYLANWRPDPDGDFDRAPYRLLYGGLGKKTHP